MARADDFDLPVSGVPTFDLRFDFVQNRCTHFFRHNYVLIPKPRYETTEPSEIGAPVTPSFGFRISKNHSDNRMRALLLPDL
jgi:hypothetical protein